MIKFKNGIDASNISGPCWTAITEFDRVLRWYTESHDTVVTEVNATAGHKNGSLHYSQRAVDFRDRHFRGLPWVPRFIAALKHHLGYRGFQIIQESDHIHVEFDPPRAA